MSLPLAEGSGGYGGQGAQMFDGGGDDLQYVVHIGVGDGFEQAEAEAGAGAVFVQTHGHQHVAGLGGSGVAGRSAADRNAFKIERDDQCFAFQIVEPDVGGVGGAGNGLAISRSAVDAGAVQLKDAGRKAVTHLGEAVDGAIVERVHGEFGGLGQAYDAGDVL